MKKKTARKPAASKSKARPKKKAAAPRRPSAPRARAISPLPWIAGSLVAAAAVFFLYKAAAPKPGSVTVVAEAADTSAALAQRYLGDAAKAWMIEDANAPGGVAPGRRVVVPLKPWNLSGVAPDGEQVVPILVYHNLAKKAGGRLVLAAPDFERQMRYLKRDGFRVVSLRDFVAWTRLERQLPSRAVVLTFDDGYRSFKTYAYPILKELGFTATLFVPTGFVGAGRAALTWDELKSMSAEGFDVEAHSYSHEYLTRNPKETDAQYERRLAREIDAPREDFEVRLGTAPSYIAYPYGNADEAVLDRVRAQGYVAGFTVKRLSSPSFVAPFLIPRRQVYSEMSLSDFAKNLETFRARKPEDAAADETRAKLLAALAQNPSDAAAFAQLRDAARRDFIPPPRPAAVPRRAAAAPSLPPAEAPAPAPEEAPAPSPAPAPTP